MEHLDEQELLIQYSEMTAFDFDSEEFQKIRKDYIQCKNFLTDLIWKIDRFLYRIKPARI